MSFNIEEVAVSEASVTLDFPEVDGAKITIARISAEELFVFTPYSFRKFRCHIICKPRCLVYYHIKWYIAPLG